MQMDKGRNQTDPCDLHQMQEKEGIIMKEQLYKFIEESETNQEIKKKLEAIKDDENVLKKMIAIAKEYGYDVNEEDFEISDEELSPDQLDEVSGGMQYLNIKLPDYITKFFFDTFGKINLTVTSENVSPEKGEDLSPEIMSEEKKKHISMCIV